VEGCIPQLLNGIFLIEINVLMQNGLFLTPPGSVSMVRAASGAAKALDFLDFAGLDDVR
jgi:hypothetical protein